MSAQQDEVSLSAPGSSTETEQLKAAGNSDANATSAATGGDDILGDEEAEIEAMKQHVAEMEAEAAKLRELQQAAGEAAGTNIHPTDEEREEVDSRSVYVANVSTA